MNRTDIEYLDLTWNPEVGCTNGCPWCWARRQAKRQKHNCRRCYDFKPHLHPERLDEPLRTREPSVIGVAFMGDLFDPMLGDFSKVHRVLDVIRRADRHTFIVLTKQPHRAVLITRPPMTPFPPNLVLGVSPTDQASADRLIPELMECPAATRIVSIEPMRGPVLLQPAWIRPQRGCDGRHSHPGPHADGSPGQPAHHHHDEFCGPRLDGVILGGQTGPGAVPLHPDWVRKVRDQCAAAGVPFFFKQWGEWKPIGLHNLVECREAPFPQRCLLPDGSKYPSRGLADVPSGAVWMSRFGRKAAGRVLDGRTHDEVPWTKGGKA